MRSYKCENCGATETDEEVKKEQVELFRLIPFEIEEQKADEAKRIWDEAKAAGFEIDGEILKQQGERYWENFEYGKLKKYTGKSASVLIHEAQVCEIKQLLTHTELNVTEIADLMNYQDVAYFCRAFKRQTGVSPSQYRINYRKL